MDQIIETLPRDNRPPLWQFADQLRRAGAMVHRMRDQQHADDFDFLMIGAAVLLDKPLIVLVPEGAHPTRKLVAHADKIIGLSRDGTPPRRLDHDLMEILATLKEGAMQ